MRTNYTKMFSESENVDDKKNNEIKKSKTPTEPKIVTVISKGKLNVRQEAKKDGDLICQVSPGDKLMVDRTRHGWSHVYTSSGIEGYVMTEFIKEA